MLPARRACGKTRPHSAHFLLALQSGCATSLAFQVGSCHKLAASEARRQDGVQISLTKLADAAGIQADATQKSAAAAKNANEQSLRFFAEGNRPWLFIDPDPADEVKIPPGGGVISVPLVIRNYGRSPAVKMSELMKYLSVIPVGPAEHKFLTTLVMKVPPSDPRDGIVTIQQPVKTWASLDRILTPQEASDLLSLPPRSHLIFCGRVEYGSPVGPYVQGKMYTESCYGYDPSQQLHWVPSVWHTVLK